MKKSYLLILMMATLVFTACAPKEEASIEGMDSETEVVEVAMTKPELTETLADKPDEESSKVMEEKEAVSEPVEDVEPPTPTTIAAEPAETTKSKDGRYNIASGSVTYTVQKEWLGKPTEAVSGTTSGVSGTVEVSGDTASVNASVNPKAFSTGSGGRDNHVAGMFSGNATISGSSISLSGGSANLSVTINGSTQTVPFSVTMTDLGGSYKATGSGSINMSSFGLKAPSIGGVYTVNDTVNVSFSVTASK